jgi:hypothetical protein
MMAREYFPPENVFLFIQRQLKKQRFLKENVSFFALSR